MMMMMMMSQKILYFLLDLDFIIYGKMSCKADLEVTPLTAAMDNKI